MHVLDHDGGLVDASCIAVIAALQHFRRPDVSIEGESVTIYSLAERVPVPLAMLHHPLCVTLSFFQNGGVILVDTTLLEQRMSEAEMVVSANKHGEVCQVAKFGGVPIDTLDLLQCMELALTKIKELDIIISNALNRDAKKRELVGMVAELKAENDR